VKAVIQERYGSPELLELREVDRPVVGADDVLVRVRAASITVADWRIVRGSPTFMRLATGMRRPKHPVPGTDVAGEVEAVGSSVTSLQPGDAVFGWCHGALAEYACAREDHFVTKPARLTFEQAATIPEAGCTALQGLRDQGRVGAGQTVLVIGASGGVGTYAVQIARALGAEVTGVCGARNVELVRSLGAHHVVDYTREDVTRRDQRYDVIFQLAGTHAPSVLRRLLTPTGTLVLSSGQGRVAGIDRIVKAMVASPFVRQRHAVWVALPNHENLVTLKGLIDAGQVTPVIDRTYPLSEASTAVGYVEAGHTRGRVAVAVTA
jgi:NADPH:quinone reductase-like Zn-dependent oxidoreductase